MLIHDDEGTILKVNDKYIDVLNYLIRGHHIDLLCEFIHNRFDDLFVPILLC